MELQILIEHLLHARLFSRQEVYSSSSYKNVFPLSLQAPKEAGKEEGEWEPGEAKVRGGTGRKGSHIKKMGEQEGEGGHSPCCLVPLALSQQGGSWHFSGEGTERSCDSCPPSDRFA